MNEVRGELRRSSTRSVSGCRVQARLRRIFRPGNQLALTHDGRRRRFGPRNIEWRGRVLNERDTETLRYTITSLNELDAQSDIGSVLESSPEHTRRVRDGRVERSREHLADQIKCRLEVLSSG